MSRTRFYLFLFVLIFFSLKDFCFSKAKAVDESVIFLDEFLVQKSSIEIKADINNRFDVDRKLSEEPVWRLKLRYTGTDIEDVITLPLNTPYEFDCKEYSDVWIPEDLVISYKPIPGEVVGGRYTIPEKVGEINVVTQRATWRKISCGQKFTIFPKGVDGSTSILALLDPRVYTVQYIQTSRFAPQNISIALSRNRKDWLPVSISSGNSHRISCQRFKYVKIVTSGESKREIERRLQCKKRYVVYWNSVIRAWDIRSIPI